MSNVSERGIALTSLRGYLSIRRRKCQKKISEKLKKIFYSCLSKNCKKAHFLPKNVEKNAQIDGDPKTSEKTPPTQQKFFRKANFLA